MGKHEEQRPDDVGREAQQHPVAYRPGRVLQRQGPPHDEREQELGHQVRVSVEMVDQTRGETGEPPADIVQEAAQLEVPKLERFLPVLATIAFLTPLLGLLGTVAGMIDAFGTIASSGGYATVTELSGGVYKSLLTTAAGLVVATPTFVAYSYLSSRINTMMHDMERAGIEIVHMLTESRPISGIISFQQPDEAMREIEARQDL